MNWLVEPLEKLFMWTFKILQFFGDAPWMIFSLVIAFGLFYWLTWQKKYDKIAEEDPNQIR